MENCLCGVFPLFHLFYVFPWLASVFLVTSFVESQSHFRHLNQRQLTRPACECEFLSFHFVDKCLSLLHFLLFYCWCRWEPVDKWKRRRKTKNGSFEAFYTVVCEYSRKIQILCVWLSVIRGLCVWGVCFL